MKAYIGGYGGAAYEIELIGSTLRYTAWSASRWTTHDQTPTTVTELVPTESDWKLFRILLDNCGVWRWHPEYASPTVDGTQWSFEIEYADQSISVEGSNCYPDKRGEPSDFETAAFESYLSAIRGLLRSKRFA
jgi:hypothetical protein